MGYGPGGLWLTGVCHHRWAHSKSRSADISGASLKVGDTIKALGLIVKIQLFGQSCLNFAKFGEIAKIWENAPNFD